MKKFRTMSLASWRDVRNILTKLEQGRIRFLADPKAFLDTISNAMWRSASFHVYQTGKGNLRGLPKLIDKAEEPWSEMYFAIGPNVVAQHADNIPYCFVTGPGSIVAQVQVIDGLAADTRHIKWTPTSVVVAKGRKVLAYHQHHHYACLSHEGLDRKQGMPFSEMRTLDDKVQVVFSADGKENVFYEAKK